MFIQDLMINHLKNLYAFYGETRGVLVARKHISWYSKGQPHAGAFRQYFNELTEAQAQLDAVEAFFTQVMERTHD